MGFEILRILDLSAAVFVALLFVRAALHKMSDASRFEGVMTDYRVLPENAVPFVARVIPWVELSVAGSLMVEVTRPFGAVLAAGLLSLYGAVMAMNLLQGRRLMDCGCDGEPEPITWSRVVRNVLLCGLVVPAAFGLAQGGSANVFLAALAAGCLAIVLWMGLEALIANATRINTAMTMWTSNTWSVS